ncbi:unnamed protein product [Enterobius vermicularis]|uniref:PDZ domain-containing protein n=1 Tax=Enterobius vermicularis TaxID=51028 RepID=A0A0N4VIC7_ENTVE|nr:unnamed protein product [Enterobius vermicularis]
MNTVNEQCTQFPDLMALHNQYTQFPDSYTLHNQYTQFPDPFIGDYFFQSMLKKISAMGFNIQDKNGNIYIGSVFPGSPAERAGNIFAGDKIKSLNISFEGMLLEDATAILGHASPYKVKLELERHIPEQPTTTAVDTNTSEVSTESEDNEGSVNSDVARSLCNEASDSTLPASSISTAVEQEVNSPSKLVNSTESLSTKPCYTSTSETVTDDQKTTDEERVTVAPATSTTPEETLESLASISTAPALPIAISPVTVPTTSSPKVNRSENSPTLSGSPKSTARVQSSEISSANSSPNAAPRSAIPRRPQPSRIPKLSPEAPVVVKEVKCNGISEFIEVSKYNYNETSVSKKRNGNAAEYCECIEPKRKSVVVEINEDEATLGDNNNQQQQQQQQEQANSSRVEKFEFLSCYRDTDEEVTISVPRSEQHFPE